MRDDPAPPPRSAPGRQNWLSIQGLRAVAALSVVVHHAGYDADTLAAALGAQPLGIDRYFDWTFGIHLFFVMSGFIMVRTARGFGQRGASLRFFGRRLLRVVPLYWLMTSLVLVGAVLAPRLLNVPLDGWSLVLGSYLFVPVTRINGEMRPVLGQGWTLDYELFFYLVFGLTMVLRRRAGLGLLAGLLVGLVSFGRIVHPVQTALAVWTDSLLLEFLLGIGVGLASQNGLRLGFWAALVLAMGGLGAAVLWGPAGRPAPNLDAWITLGTPAAMILGAATWGPAWPPRPLLLALGALGDASYSLYLTHPFVIRLLRVGWQSLIADAVPLNLFPVLASMAAVAVSLAVYRWIERPMTTALRTRFPLAGPPEPSTPSPTPDPRRCGR